MEQVCRRRCLLDLLVAPEWCMPLFFAAALPFDLLCTSLLPHASWNPRESMRRPVSVKAISCFSSFSFFVFISSFSKLFPLCNPLNGRNRCVGLSFCETIRERTSQYQKIIPDFGDLDSPWLRRARINLCPDW